MQLQVEVTLLVQIMKDKKIDVMSLQETWVNTNSEEVVDGYHFIFSSGVENADREERIKRQQNRYRYQLTLDEAFYLNPIDNSNRGYGNTNQKNSKRSQQEPITQT